MKKLVSSALLVASLAITTGCSLLLNVDPQCESSSDCGPNLLCSAGLCVRPDAGVDGGTTPQDDTVAWVLSYFESGHELTNDSLHLAYSTDGLHWVELGPGAPELQLSGIGTNHIRDPFILRKQDGTFVYIATDWTLSNNDANYWSNPSSSVVIAESTDLITFTNPHLLRVTSLSGPGGSAMHAWAPEAFWDPQRSQYGIIWSGNDTTGKSIIYVSYTTDFQSVVNDIPTVFFDPGYSTIDGTLVPYEGRNYLFFKDESNNDGQPATGSGKDIQIAVSPDSTFTPGAFNRWSPEYVTRGTQQSVRQATEGPFVVKIRNQNLWYMCGDYFLNGSMGCWSTTNLDASPSTWTRLADSSFSFPAGTSHSNTVRVTQPELDALISHYGIIRDYKIRTNYSEGGSPFYFMHSWYHGVITFEGDTTGNLLANDDIWRVVPALGGNGDPDEVSFRPVSQPANYFLRIDSANLSRYPSCTSDGANHHAELCNLVPSGERNHLTFVDPFVDTPTFRSDATFKRVPALNGDTSMVSFQWNGDPTMYLRHSYYQMFVRPVSTAQEMDDASFTMEEQ